MMNQRNSAGTQWMWGMRGIAILCVILYHWYLFFPAGWLSTAVRAGAQGAHTFFILSAFGLYLSLQRRHGRIDVSWFVKRFLKVLVPYYMAIAVVCGAVMLYGLCTVGATGALGQFDINVRSLMASVFLYRGFMDQYVFVINIAWWFAVTILEFYLLFPLLCLLYRSVPPLVFLGLTLAANLIYQYVTVIVFNVHAAVFAKLFMTFLFEFALGMYLADVFGRNPALFYRLTTGWLPLCAGVVLRLAGAYLALKGREGYAFSSILTALGFSLIAYNVYLVMFPRLKTICEWLGRHAFGLFLLHTPFIAMLHNIVAKHPIGGVENVLWLAAFMAGMCAGAYVFHCYLINKNPLVGRHFAA